MPFIPYLRDVAGIGLCRFTQKARRFGPSWRALNKLGWTIRAHDGMTGVLTAEEFRRRVEAQWHKCPDAAVLLFDADHLAHVNHAAGIEATDACLVAMGCVISLEAEGAWVGRVGGDEFAVFVKDAARAECIAARIRASTEQSFRTERAAVIEKFPQLAAHPVLTFSVGAAKVVPGLTLMQALKRGEEALSAAKIAGRNRLCWAP